MGEAHGERLERAVAKHRADRLDVGQVVAAGLGQVEQPDIARRETRRSGRGQRGS